MAVDVGGVPLAVAPNARGRGRAESGARIHTRVHGRKGDAGYATTSTLRHRRRRGKRLAALVE